MKKLLSFGLIFTLFAVFGCEQTARTPQPPAPERVDYQKIKEQLRKEQMTYAEVWNNKDMNAISEIWAHDDDITIFGPAERERVLGWEGPNGVKAWYEGAFASMASVDFKIHDMIIKVTKEGTVAVVTYYVENDFVDQDGNKGKMTPRVTVIKELRDGKWKQIHGDASFSIAEMQQMK